MPDKRRYEVTVRVGARRMVAATDLSRDDAMALADKVNEGKVKGQEDALIAPVPKSRRTKAPAEARRRDRIVARVA